MAITPNLQEALLGYISGINVDVSNSARAQAARTGAIQGTPEYANAFRNAVINHAIAFGESEGRPGAEQLVNVVTNERNLGFDPVTGISITPPDDGGSDNDGGSGGGDVAGGGGSTGGGSTGGEDTGGEDTGDVTSAITTALAPLLNRLTDIESNQTSLMSPPVVGTATPAPTPATATDLEPITEDVGDVQADTTAIRGDIGTRAEGQPATLMGQTAGLAQGQTDITGRIGTAPTPDATLFSGQEGLAQDLTTAQQGITGVQAGIGEAPVDPTTGDPTTLFQGQAGLMAGQTGLTGAISGVGSQASAIGSDLTALTNQLTNFENLSNADRANLLSTLNTRATELKDLANTYGLQTNRIAEQLTGVPAPTGMMAQAAPVAGSLPAVLAAVRAQNTATQNINRGLMDVAEQGQVGALGPVTPDPRVG